MKRILSLFSIVFLGLGLFIPSLSFAQDALSCDAGTVECYCPPSISTDDLNSNPINSVDAISICENTCYDIALEDAYFFSDIESWAVQCEIGGVLTAVAGGRVDFIEDISDGAEEGLNDLVGTTVEPPRLGIEIPGFDSSLATSSISDGEYQTNVLGQYVKAVYAWLISAGAIVAVLMIMIGGVQYMLAGGNQGDIRQAKKRIVDAMSGLVLLLGAFTIAFLIDPSTVAFETLTLKYIDPVEYIGASNDLAGQLFSTPGSNVIPTAILCDPSLSIEEIAKSTIGNVTYRYGAKGGPPIYSAETKVDRSGKAYSSYCPEGTLCLDCSGYADFLRTCAGLPAADETSGTAGIFGENCSNSELVTSWDESGIVNGTALVPGDLLGRPSNHVLVYIGNGQVADSHGSGRDPGSGVGIYSISFPLNSLYPDDACLKRR